MPSRRWVRAGHVTGGLLLLVWIWTPLRELSGTVLPAQIVLSALALSGALMWPLPRLLAARRASRGRDRDAIGRSHVSP